MSHWIGCRFLPPFRGWLSFWSNRLEGRLRGGKCSKPPFRARKVWLFFVEELLGSAVAHAGACSSSEDCARIQGFLAKEPRHSPQIGSFDPGSHGRNKYGDVSRFLLGRTEGTAQYSLCSTTEGGWLPYPKWGTLPGLAMYFL